MTISSDIQATAEQIVQKWWDEWPGSHLPMYQYHTKPLISLIASTLLTERNETLEEAAVTAITFFDQKYADKYPMFALADARLLISIAIRALIDRPAQKGE